MPQPSLKLTPGQYRFATTTPAQTLVYYTVTEDAILVPFTGPLEWKPDPDGGHYERGGVAVVCYPDGTFVAVNGAESFGGTWQRVS